MRIRRPHWIRLRLQLYRLRVRYAIAQLHRLSSANRSRCGVKILNRQLFSAKLLERDAIERIMEGVPRMERAPGVGLRVVAASTAVDLPRQ